MTTKDSLGDRMKRYESVTQSDLMKRTPVIVRIDGKAFHTWTKCLSKYDVSLDKTPFSVIMNEVMTFTTQHLVDTMQGCVLGYTQSDEISLLLRDWDTFETEAWFDNNLQKIVSVSAAEATAAFNFKFGEVRTPMSMKDMAKFDSRAYNLPKEEVANYFLWRQNDASRNSVQMYGRHFFSSKQMHGKSNSEVQDMLMAEHSANWNDLPTWMRRGTCVTRDGVDKNIPIFSQDRAYIEQHVYIDKVAE
jgi:tRNA(His) guanylyltransferase